MKGHFFVCLLLAIYPALSPQDIHRIADKIWKNECAGTLDGLTCWNKGENFGSFGIGHLIWYPENQEEKFQETFPQFLKYLQQEKVRLPVWLSEAKKCPWNNREEFYQNISSPKMLDLRQVLLDTKDFQAHFITKRFEKTLSEIMKNLPIDETEHIKTVVSNLAKHPQGLYAMIDYLNFKGSGISPTETYKGQGWGLLQVLQRIPRSSKSVVDDFVESAKVILTQRVQNSPHEREEKKWLNGWLNRVNTYLE